MAMKDKRSKLVAERVRNGYTQKQLGDKIGVTTTTIVNWENKTSMPNTAYLAPLADALGMTVEEVVGLFAEND